MTPDQLQRKRAMDRVAQRATRARARQHMQRLEQQVEELRTAVALEPAPVDRSALQSLSLRNQVLAEELARLQRQVVSGPGASPVSQASGADMSQMSASPVPSSPMFASELQPLPDATMYYPWGDCMGSPALSAQAFAAPCYADSSPEQLFGWQRAGLWSSNADSLGLSGPTSSPAAAMALPPLSYDLGLQCTIPWLF